MAAVHPSASLPQYPEMIMVAIDALNDGDGCDAAAISSYIESNHADLPAAHSTLLSHHLDKLKDGGELNFVNKRYLKADVVAASPPSSAKRGRGRPPKSQAGPPSGGVTSPADPKPRGRPPLPRDSDDTVSSAKKPKADGSGKSRGRPSKKEKGTDSPTVEGAVSGGSRPRGRPPKGKTPVAAVEC